MVGHGKIWFYEIALTILNFFFCFFSDVIQQLKSTGKIDIPSDAECEQLLNTKLKCHRCDAQLQNMPKLKEHLLTHKP